MDEQNGLLECSHEIKASDERTVENIPNIEVHINPEINDHNLLTQLHSAYEQQKDYCDGIVLLKDHMRQSQMTIYCVRNVNVT